MVLHKCEAVQQRNCVSSSHLGSTWIQITANLCIPAHSTICGFHLGSKRPVLLDQSQLQPGDFILYLIVFFFLVSLTRRYDRVNINKLCLYFYSFGKTGVYSTFHHNSLAIILPLCQSARHLPGQWTHPGKMCRAKSGSPGPTGPDLLSFSDGIAPPPGPLPLVSHQRISAPDLSVTQRRTSVKSDSVASRSKSDSTGPIF